MYGARDEFFASSGFTGYQNRGISTSHLGHPREHRSQGRRSPHDLLKHGRAVNFLSQQDVLIAKCLFSSLAVIDVGTSNVPTHNLSLVVEHGIVASQKPTIASIALAQLQLQIVSRAGQQRTLWQSREQFRVLRMSFRAKTSLPPFIQTNAEVI